MVCPELLLHAWGVGGRGQFHPGHHVPGDSTRPWNGVSHGSAPAERDRHRRIPPPSTLGLRTVHHASDSLGIGNYGWQGSKGTYCQAIANMSSRNVQPAECLRVVIETLIQDEEEHQVSLDTEISDAACERMGDVLEAAGGLLDPYTPAAKPFMMSMHEPHGIDFTNDADAFRSLQGPAQSTKELAGMLPTPKAAAGSPGDNRARMWAILKELRPDELVLDPKRCKGCWVCGEITRLHGGRRPAQ